MEIEVTAKKVEDAINQGLIQLGATIDEVNVEVLSAGGLFHKARVKLTLEREQKPQEQVKPKEQPKPQEKPQVQAAAKKPEQKAEPSSKNAQAPLAAQQQKEPSAQQAALNEQSESAVKSQQKQPKKQKPQAAKPQQGVQAPRKVEAKPQEQGESDASQDQVPARREENKAAQEHAHEFVKNVVEKMGFADVSYEIENDGETIAITAPAGDDSLIIGRHGETLSALAYLAETSVRAEKSRVSITVDCNGYRGRRAASLTAMARRRADECVAKRRKIKLEPMERIDRRTIHNALNDDARVSTASEGKEPYRYIVIIPQKRGE